MESIFHFIGICGDAHSHFDILDLLLFGGTSMPLLIYFIKFKIKTILFYIKFLFKKKWKKKIMS